MTVVGDAYFTDKTELKEISFGCVLYTGPRTEDLIPFDSLEQIVKDMIKRLDILEAEA